MWGAWKCYWRITGIVHAFNFRLRYVSAKIREEILNKNCPPNSTSIIVNFHFILGSEKFHLRSCVTGPQSLTGKCFDKDEGKRRLCYCTTDECNANLESAKLHNIANQMDVSFIVTIIVSIFSFYFFWLMNLIIKHIPFHFNFVLLFISRIILCSKYHSNTCKK